MVRVQYLQHIGLCSEPFQGEHQHRTGLHQHASDCRAVLGHELSLSPNPRRAVGAIGIVGIVVRRHVFLGRVAWHRRLRGA